MIAQAYVLHVVVYLSNVGLGLVALPVQAITAIANPAQTVAGRAAALVGAVDGGASSQGYYLQATMAAPMVVNLGNLNTSWVKNNNQDYLGVRLGALNTTAPINCPGAGTVLQFDAQIGDYSAKLSRIGGDSATVAARIEYTCN